MKFEPIRKLAKNPSMVIAGLVVLAVLLVFRRLLAGEVVATNDATGNDLFYLNLPFRTVLGESLRQGEFLHWTPMMYGGFPLFAQGEGSFLYPLTLVLWGCFSSITALNIFYVLHAVVMGVGTLGWITSLTRKPWVAAPGAIAAALCGSLMVGHLRHLNAFAIFSLTPWLFWTVESFVQKPHLSRAVLFGTLIGLMVLTGHPQFLFLVGFLAWLYLPLSLLLRHNQVSHGFPARHPHLSWGKFFLFTCVSGAISLLIGAPQLWATLELLGFTKRRELIPEQVTLGSLPWNGLQTFVNPYFYGDAGAAQLIGGQQAFLFWEYYHFVGVITLVLALAGVIWGWNKTGTVRVLAVLGIFSYLLALGKNFPLYKIFSLLPFVGTFRFQARWLIGTELAILALSGFGVLAVVELSRRWAERRKQAQRSPEPDGVGPEPRSPSGLDWQMVGSLVLGMCSLVEMLVVNGSQVVTTDPQVFLKPPPFINRLQTADSFGRLYSLDPGELHGRIYVVSHGWKGDLSLYQFAAWALPPNFALMHRVSIINAYPNLTPDYVYTIWGDLRQTTGSARQALGIEREQVTVSPGFLQVARMFGVRYVTSLWKLPPPFIPIWEEPGILGAYELPEPFPRAWVVARTSSNPNLNVTETANQLLQPEFNPRQTALVSGAPPTLPATAANGEAKILESENHSLTVEAQTPGLVVVSDTWYPNWKATVDGVETPIFRVNGMMRGVVAPRAGSIIHFWYDRRLSRLLILLSYTVLVISFGHAMVDYRRQRKSETSADLAELR